jgi:three-Cys-motif partner protein
VNTTDLYDGRRQTEAKHFILRQYLYALAFKVLSPHISTSLTFVDGFSGPWKARDSENFSDTSFGIAIQVLEDVANHFRDAGTPKQIRCVFNEKDPAAFAQLQAAVLPHNDPTNGFTVATINKPFVDAVPEIVSQVLPESFVYTFIDPTGWTGYPYDKIKPLLSFQRSEVLINFMYDHINRFRDHVDPSIIGSLAPIMGGPDWQERLDPNEPDRAVATMRLARQVLKESSGYAHTCSTMINREIRDRPHFALMIGTNKPVGIRTFRDVERKALRVYESKRQRSKEAVNPAKAAPLLEGLDLPDTFDAYLEATRLNAKDVLKRQLLAREKEISFGQIWLRVCAAVPLTVSDVKDICVDLAKEGFIETTWASPGSRKRKPDDEHIIRLAKRDT